MTDTGRNGGAVERGPSPIRLRANASLVSIVAFVLGALPAALAGLGLAWILVTAGIATVVVAAWMARRQLRAVTAISGPDRVVVAEGRTSYLRVTISLRHSASDILISLTAPDASAEEIQSAPRVALTNLRGAHSREYLLPLRIPRRGRRNRLTIHLASSFPFGLVRGLRTIPIEIEVTIHPRVLDRRDRRMDPWLRMIGAGTEEDIRARGTARSQGLPMTIRTARHGDTARDIAWRHSVRRMRWLAVDRTPTARPHVVVTLVPEVFGRGAYGTRPYGPESGGASADDPRARGAGARSSGRREMAFEWSVRAVATLVVRLAKLGHSVTTRVAEGGTYASLDEAAVAPWSAEVRSRRITDHLEMLTDVALAGVAPASGGATSRSASGQRARGALAITLFPIVRAGVVGAHGALPEPPRRTGSQSPPHRMLIGVDAVGRMVALDPSRQEPAARDVSTKKARGAAFQPGSAGSATASEARST